ncbi:MltA domain-containing protein [Paracoccus sp. p3-h83]|uniref:MltA domain-containing protein n=1 Tax=Paracoccus sp. p3-h83 TaxID=3342805 RepID=UPI0035BAED58
MAELTDLPGWADDDAGAALAAYRLTADLTDLPQPPADAGGDWFAHAFVAGPAQPAFFTGYYEPELPGSDRCSTDFPVPLLALPPGLMPGPQAPDRAAILTGIFDHHALCWLADPLEAFLAQVQGSVRVRLPDGRLLRLCYAGRNGHPYRSIGKELVARGAVAADAIDVQAIRDWCAAHPQGVEALLGVNPSYVFFRPLDLPADAGPLGAMGRSVTPWRSIAVDPAHVPLGSPVWVQAPGFAPRLVIAQDIGGAIKGAGRGDLYIGSGDEAGRVAGGIRTPGQMVVLSPRGSRP